MKIIKLKRMLCEHPLILFLVSSTGNSKNLLLLEPLWGIPYNLITPFATLYMHMQGITDVEIGLILSVSMVVQVFFSFSGGIIADKLGRKTSTILGDFFGWSVACFIWAISNNFWLFLTAVLINSFEQINQTSWHCLLIEDAPEKDMLSIYTWVTIGGLVSVFFAPISGILIDHFSLIPVIRILYLIFSVNMMIKCYITYRCTTETKQGIIRKEQTKAVPIPHLIYEYKNLVQQIFRNKVMIRMMLLTVILHITNMISGSFFNLYINTRLGIAEHYLAFFPILRTLIMLIFMFAIQHRLDRIQLKLPMWTGLIIYVVCQIMLILIPRGNILPVVLYVFLESTAMALVMPRKDAMLAINVESQERARIMALMTAFMIAFTSPFGYLAGLLSSIDQRLPFVLACILYSAAIWIVGQIHEGRTDR